MAWGNKFVPAVSGGALYPNVAKPPAGTPGAMNRAVYPAFSLPAFSIQGPGFIYGNGRGPAVVATVPMLDYARVQVIDGINGTVFGGIYQQGLINLEAYVNGRS